MATRQIKAKSKISHFAVRDSAWYDFVEAATPWYKAARILSLNLILDKILFVLELLLVLSHDLLWDSRKQLS